MITENRPVFSRGAVLSYGRSIGVSDTVFLKFMQEEGVIVVDDNEGRQVPGQAENGAKHTTH
jgi:hypothetical protein